MENRRRESHPGPAAVAGVSQRAYVQLALLGAMVPVEVATMLKWSTPAGALLLGGTVAASVTSEVGPRAWARIRGGGRTHEAAHESGGRSITLRLSVATKGSPRLTVRGETVEAALRRVCRKGDAVATSASGEFVVELRGWTTIDPEAVGRRLVLAVENRIDVKLTVEVEPHQSAEEQPAPVESPEREAIHEFVDGYSLRRSIFGGEPNTATSAGGELLRRARMRLQFFAPVAA